MAAALLCRLACSCNGACWMRRAAQRGSPSLSLCLPDCNADASAVCIWPADSSSSSSSSREFCLQVCCVCLTCLVGPTINNKEMHPREQQQHAACVVVQLRTWRLPHQLFQISLKGYEPLHGTPRQHPPASCNAVATLALAAAGRRWSCSSGSRGRRSLVLAQSMRRSVCGPLIVLENRTRAGWPSAARAVQATSGY